MRLVKIYLGMYLQTYDVTSDGDKEPFRNFCHVTITALLDQGSGTIEVPGR